ncbi:hypothetical protein cyc_00468 [Cyclospora cayetanensis]|uniref:Uncharacterized protein n=1 Tax=Cyclospora cayetanensis TaxID=88456 RepID=A0A1D3CUW6_9EIME|nr:hypothetical protein cyc_00468 [Cyclospora cayetanensis]
MAPPPPARRSSSAAAAAAGNGGGAATVTAIERAQQLEALLREVVLINKDIAKPGNLPLNVSRLLRETQQQKPQKHVWVLKLCPCTPEQAAAFRLPRHFIHPDPKL